MQISSSRWTKDLLGIRGLRSPEDLKLEIGAWRPGLNGLNQTVVFSPFQCFYGATGRRGIDNSDASVPQNTEAPKVHSKNVLQGP